ncbi:MAG TPA: hypothetical protein VNI54_03910 [Thermoanaerobaculia bacterium]|nr:hypothetical protein [Thermoanaerobaculia bacterium]
MTKVEALEREVDWQAWDRQIERDSADGRLDRVAAEALAELERGEAAPAPQMARLIR